MKNDTTFVRMPNGDHPGDSKMSKYAHRVVEFKLLTNHVQGEKLFLQNERRRVDLHSLASDVLTSAPGFG